MAQYNPKIHHRRSMRLKGYDYSQKGLYFVTISTQHHQQLFGNVINGKMILNDAGQMIEKWYYELENKYPDIKCHEQIVMPNHFHCIIENTARDEHTGSSPQHRPHNTARDEHTGSSPQNSPQNRPHNIARDEHTGSSPQHSPQHRPHNIARDEHTGSSLQNSPQHRPHNIARDEHTGSSLQNSPQNRPHDIARANLRVRPQNHPQNPPHNTARANPQNSPHNTARANPQNPPHNTARANLRVRPDDTARANLHVRPDDTSEQMGTSLHRVMQWFKTMTTNEYIRGVKNKNWQRFNGKLWLRSYWEHIIRDERAYRNISRYIINNPSKWTRDKFNGGIDSKTMESSVRYDLEMESLVEYDLEPEKPNILNEWEDIL